MSRWEKNAEVWKSLPRRSTFTFLLAVFLLFSGIGLIVQIPVFARLTVLQRVTWMLATACVVTAFAFFSSRRMIKSMIALGMFQFFLWPAIGAYQNWASGHRPTPLLSLAAVERVVSREAGFAVFLTIIAYGAFVVFFRREGVRFFKSHNEIRLAAEIHKGLVPKIDRRVGAYEFYGASLPSGQVGGDLVDVAEDGAGWVSYVADVSGHGVPAGVLMAMVKSAGRMRLERPCETGEFLADMNRVLLPLTSDDRFVTAACVRSTGDGPTLQFSLAGHLPILHFQPAAATVVEHSDSNLPLGIIDAASFESSAIHCEPGDVLAVFTDGFTETFDGKQELGIEGIRQILRESGRKTLPQIFDEVLRKTHRHGPQQDDQTLLLIRLLPDSTSAV